MAVQNSLGARCAAKWVGGKDTEHRIQPVRLEVHFRHASACDQVIAAEMRRAAAPEAVRHPANVLSELGGSDVREANPHARAIDHQAAAPAEQGAFGVEL